MSRKSLNISTLLGVGVDDPRKANFVIEYSKDFDARRAAVASGFGAEKGYKLREEPAIEAALFEILQHRLNSSHIDAEWVLMEMVDNHILARQNNNLSASNTALKMVGQHAMVDAFAAEKVQVSGDEQIKERLLRARSRKNKQVPSFL